MSLPIPLVVSLSTDRAVRRITRQVRDLSFRSVAPGGFASATISLDRPLSFQPDEIAHFGRIYIHDARTGRVAWEGRLADPGRSAGNDGQVWDLAAIGPSGHASDRATPLLYADKILNHWSVSQFNRVNVDPRIDDGGDASADGDGNSGWRMAFPQGAGVTTSTRADVHHILGLDAGQDLARFSAIARSGVTGANWQFQLRSSDTTGVGASTTLIDSEDSADPAPAMSGSRGGATAITAGHQVAHLRFQRIGASTTLPDNNHWALFTDVKVRGLLKDASGTDITSGYSLDTVLASEVVADLLGRLLPLYDGANASIETTSYPIEQLAYDRGVTAAEVLDDLMLLESAYYWAAWESNSAGLYRFEWTTWPTSVRYEADILDGYSSVGSADSLYNAVRVSYIGVKGRNRVVRRTAAVPVLDDAGLVREGYIDLRDEVGDRDGAEKAGDDFLEAHSQPLNAGRLTVSRPVLDHDKGTMVNPWEIRPGHLVRVRGIQPRVDSLNATGRDGVSVFRIVSTEFRASDASVVLELDSYSPTVARALADLQSRVARA